VRRGEMRSGLRGKERTEQRSTEIELEQSKADQGRVEESAGEER